MGVIAKGILRGCLGLFTPVFLGNPLSVFNKKLYSQDKKKSKKMKKEERGRKKRGGGKKTGGGVGLGVQRSVGTDEGRTSYQ